MDRMLARSAAVMLAASGALPTHDDLAAELESVAAAASRGYFLPDEDEFIRLRYSQYLGLRAAMLDTLAELGGAAGRGDVASHDRLPVFVVTFAAACMLMRADRYLVELAGERSVLWKKLDEADVRVGIPRKTFTGIYKAIADPLSMGRFLLAADFYYKHHGEILALAGDSVVGPVATLLLAEEATIERRRRDALKRLIAYRWFSFLRRHRSAWNKVMFGFFEASGRAVADLRQPGIKPTGAPKRIDGGLRTAVLEQALPGDVFVTRHDDALSNLFLPGFWPHAALYLGTSAELAKMEIRTPAGEGDGPWFLEAKKDGVRIRQADETLRVDALVMLRPPLALSEVETGIRRAMTHAGKPYDFLFDFRAADRIVCTEVIYRGFHGIGPVRFELREVSGRLCLPAEELLNQALKCGFRLIGSAGLRGDRLLTGMEAELAFQANKQL
jgi:hypothetical protein